jgi:hypothetical protein
MVFAAFLLMVVSSCLFMNRTLNKKLLEHAEEAINDMQSVISHALAAPEVPINFIADTIQDMIVRREGFESIKAYMAECSTDKFKEKIHLFKESSICGFFEVFNAFYDGRGWTPPESYVPRERPWYIAAANSGDKVGITSAYKETASGALVISYAKSLFDPEGRFLGVVSIRVPLSFIEELFENKRITENSYGYIVNEQLVVVTHPSRDLVGKVMGINHPDIARVAELIKQDREVSLYPVKGYRDVNS